jgi:hypothetical protein
VAGKTISMHASEDTVRRMEHVSRVEDRTPSQIASAALNFYLQLNPEVHSALRYVQALGTADDLTRVNRDIARLLLDAQYQLAVRQMGRTLEGRPAPETEDELLAEAERLVSGELPEAASAMREPVPARSRKAS